MKIEEYVNTSYKDKAYIKSYRVCLNPKENGGEAITLIVDAYDNGDKENNIWTNAHIETQCYGSHESRLSFHNFDNLFKACKLVAGKMVEL